MRHLTLRVLVNGPTFQLEDTFLILMERMMVTKAPNEMRHKYLIRSIQAPQDLIRNRLKLWTALINKWELEKNKTTMPRSSKLLCLKISLLQLVQHSFLSHLKTTSPQLGHLGIRPRWPTTDCPS